MTFICAKNVSFCYDDMRLILDQVSFSLDRGDTLALLGPSGSGKTTLLRLLAGLLPATSQETFHGSITIDEVAPRGFRERESVSFFFQDFGLLPHLNVHDNVEFPVRARNGTGSDATREVLEMVGLSRFASYYPKDLSGGMKARVALARCFVTNPLLLLLDEPFVSLDIGWRSKLTSELETLQHLTGATMVMVTHDVDDALRLGTQIVVLNSLGKIGLVIPNTVGMAETAAKQAIRSAILDGHPCFDDQPRAL